MLSELPAVTFTVTLTGPASANACRFHRQQACPAVCRTAWFQVCGHYCDVDRSDAGIQAAAVQRGDHSGHNAFDGLPRHQLRKRSDATVVRGWWGAAASAESCADGGQRESLTFPNITTTSVGNNYDCTSSNPTAGPYTFPSTTAGSLTNMTYKTGSTTVTETYQVTGFLSDYRTDNQATL